MPISYSQLQQQGQARPANPLWSLGGPRAPTNPVVPGAAHPPSSGRLRPHRIMVSGTRIPEPITEPRDQPDQGPLNNQYLWNRYAGYRGMNPLDPNSLQVQHRDTPQYQQGGRTMSSQGQSSPQVPQAGTYSPFDYSPMEQFSPQGYQAIGGPTPTTTGPGQFSPTSSPYQTQLEQTLGASLANPSAYNSENVASQYDVLNRRLGQGFDVQRQQINEDMARRGIFNSTIAGGRLGDVATNQAQAQSDLATNLLNSSADRYGRDRQAAIAQAMGYSGLNFGNQLAGYQANLAGSGQAFQQDLATRAFQGDQQAMEVLNSLQRGQFAQGQQQQGFNQAAQGYGMNQNAQNQNFNQQALGAQMGNSFANDLLSRQMGIEQYNQGLSQQDFENQMSQSNLVDRQGQQDVQNRLAGQGINMAGNQQNFDQQQQLLQNLMGFNQGQFQNWATKEGLRQTGDQFNQLMPFLLGLLPMIAGAGRGRSGQQGGQPPSNDTGEPRPEDNDYA